MIVLCFRPRTGDYFFIDISVPQRTVLPAGKFPSPYWGLFFYHIQLPLLNLDTKDISFRPRTGDYFFITLKKVYQTISHRYQFPSPYWGLFFYHGIMSDYTPKGGMKASFRPRTGDYFFIARRLIHGA